MPSTKAIMNWSGGKDAALCLHRVLARGGYDVVSLLTTVNGHFGRVSQHGVRTELLRQQAARIGLPLATVEMPEYPSMETYNRLMEETLSAFREQGAAAAIYGDILLEDLRAYREEQLERADLRGVFPLWEEPTGELVREFIGAGFKAIVVCVNEQHLDKSFAGRELDEDFLADLPSGVDPCGENGEFHTFVYDGPIFTGPVSFSRGETIHRTYDPPETTNADDPHGSQDPERMGQTGFWYCDLVPAGTTADRVSTGTDDRKSAHS